MPKSVLFLTFKNKVIWICAIVSFFILFFHFFLLLLLHNIATKQIPKNYNNKVVKSTHQRCNFDCLGS